MSEQKPFSALTGFALAALVVLIAGTGFAVWTGFNFSQRSTDILVDPEKPDVPAPGQAQIYWVAPDPNNEAAIAFVPQNVPFTDQSQEGQIQRAMTILLAAPGSAVTAIPPQTTLLSLNQTPEGIKIDLSKEFTEGGGSSAMISRLGQIIYTATSTDPSQPVWLSVQGEPLTVLGGEGLMVDQPITRKQFEADFMVFDN